MDNICTKLKETGTVYVTLAAAKEMADAAGVGVEEARKSLTRILMDANAGQDDKGMRSDPEVWRYRRQSDRVDIIAKIVREGELAVVVRVQVKALRTSRIKD